VRRRAYIAAALLAAVLALDTAGSTPAYRRLRSSAHNFRHHFRELKRADMSTVERLVFSLVLSHSEKAADPYVR
jgi:hypothetical protein